MRIWKAPLDIVDLQVIEMPGSGYALDAQFQNGTLCLWMLVDETIQPEMYIVRIFGTGNPIPSVNMGRYVGTAQDGMLVWHVFILQSVTG